MKEIVRAWITLNRDCNLRCKWCYAQSTGYNCADRMPFRTVIELLELISYSGASQVIFIGGEPTCNENLIEIIKYAKRLSLHTTLITNGIKLSDEEYLGELAVAGLSSIDISLKGFSENDYLTNTGINAYAEVMNAIRNTAKVKNEFIVSMVLTGDNIEYFYKGIYDAADSGAKSFSFSLCNDFSALVLNEVSKNYDIENNIFKVINGFEKHYEELCRITKGNFLLHQTFPLCAWDPGFINKLINSSHVISSCQLFEQNSIIFDTNANVIPCNSMYQAPIGQYKKDFSNSSELIEYWNSERITNYYKLLALTPPSSAKCTKCKNWEFCGGGCISNWYNFSLEELMIAKENFYRVK